MKRALLILTISSLALAACDADPSQLMGRNRGGASGENADGIDPNDPEAVNARLSCTEKPEGRSYLGFDGRPLEASRANENTGINRARQKSGAALRSELARVLGKEPASAADLGTGDDAPRWLTEPTTSAVEISTFFGVAFEGCRAYTATDARFAAEPTEESAQKECASLMRKAFSRTPSPEETGSCAALSKELSKEPDPRRRWAYICASVLSSTRFQTF